MNARETAHLCRTLGAIFAYGCSNGGMFVHHLARRLPEHFRPWQPTAAANHTREPGQQGDIMAMAVIDHDINIIHTYTIIYIHNTVYMYLYYLMSIYLIIYFYIYIYI